MKEYVNDRNGTACIMFSKEVETIIKKGKEQIDCHRVVFFDIFDTLIARDCSAPHDLFDYVEKEYNKDGKRPAIAGFRFERVKAELRCYQNKEIPSLDRIYEQLPYTKKEKKDLQQLEQEMELNICTRKYIGFELYNYAVNMKRTIVAVSDMYLSASILYRLLLDSGYSPDRVVVSNEHNCDKKSGRLFEFALKAVNADKREVIHFGDNYRSDIIGARKAGIACMQIPQKHPKLTYMKHNFNNSADDRLTPFIRNRLLFANNKVSSLGFEVCGAMVVGFCQWLHSQIENENYDKVLFCARDVKQTLDVYRGMYPEHKDKVDYLFVSLKSLQEPYMASIGKDTSEKAKQSLKYICQYFEQIGCYGKIAIVDSGYGGHTLQMINTILKDKCTIHGLYMRISKNFRKNAPGCEVRAYMFQKKPEVKSYICGAFFETMISATHGRTNGYEPQISSNQGSVETEIVPLLGDDNPQKKLLEQFQAGIDFFSKEWNHSYFRDHLIKGADVEKAFLKFAFFPIKEDVIALESITGGNEEYGEIVIKRNRGHYCIHIKDFFIDLRETYWKGGFLQRCFGAFYKPFSFFYLLLDSMLLNIIGF